MKFRIEWVSGSSIEIEAESKEKAIELFKEEPLAYVDTSDILDRIRVDEIWGDDEE